MSPRIWTLIYALWRRGLAVTDLVAWAIERGGQPPDRYGWRDKQQEILRGRR